jgi:hypothetical protein
LHTASALCSGFVAALLSTPADVCKSRVMSGELTCKQMVWWFGAWRVGWCGIASCRSAAAWCYCCCGCGGLKVHQVLEGLFRLCARWCTNGAGTDEEISGLRCSLEPCTDVATFSKNDLTSFVRARARALSFSLLPSTAPHACRDVYRDGCLPHGHDQARGAARIVEGLWTYLAPSRAVAVLLLDNVRGAADADHWRGVLSRMPPFVAPSRTKNCGCRPLERGFESHATLCRTFTYKELRMQTTGEGF